MTGFGSYIPQVVPIDRSQLSCLHLSPCLWYIFDDDEPQQERKHAVPRAVLALVLARILYGCKFRTKVHKQYGFVVTLKRVGAWRLLWVVRDFQRRWVRDNAKKPSKKRLPREPIPRYCLNSPTVENISGRSYHATYHGADGSPVVFESRLGKPPHYHGEDWLLGDVPTQCARFDLKQFPYRPTNYTTVPLPSSVGNPLPLVTYLQEEMGYVPSAALSVITAGHSAVNLHDRRSARRLENVSNTNDNDGADEIDDPKYFHRTHSGTMHPEHPYCPAAPSRRTTQGSSRAYERERVKRVLLTTKWNQPTKGGVILVLCDCQKAADVARDMGLSIESLRTRIRDTKRLLKKDGGTIPSLQ